jgi:hypothetical protein
LARAEARTPEEMVDLLLASGAHGRLQGVPG